MVDGIQLQSKEILKMVFSKLTSMLIKLASRETARFHRGSEVLTNNYNWSNHYDNTI